MDQIASDILNALGQTEQPTEQPAAPQEPQQITAPPADQAVGQPAGQPAPADEAVEGCDDPEIGKPRVAEFGGKKEWHFEPARGRRLYELAKAGRQYEELFGSPEAARQMAEKAVALDNLLADVASGDPARAEQVARYLGRDPQSFSVIADRVLHVAREAHPDTYTSMARTVASDLAEYFYSVCAGYPKNSPEAAAALQAAQYLDYFLTGKYRKLEEVRSAVQEDPRDAELETLRSQLKRRDEMDWTAWRNATDSDIRSEVGRLIESSLAPIAEVRERAPLLWKAATNELREALQDAIRQNTVFCQQFGSRYQQAQRTRSPEDRKALVDMYVSQARRFLAAKAGQVVNEVSRAFVAQSKETHAKLAASEGRAEPSPSGSPRAPRISNPGYEEAKGKKDVTAMVQSLLT